MATYQREVAWRIFAREFNDSDLELKGEGERAPSYVVSPLGAKVNRLFVVGVLTRAEPVSPDSDMWRAQISDPTGVFHVYAGQYQPEAAAALKELDPPCFVAVVGKSRTYRPEDGRVLVSITPEVVKEVDRETRDRWVLETVRHTRTRLEAIDGAGEDAGPDALRADGIHGDLADGLAAAVPHYGTDRVDGYLRMVRGSLEYLVSGSSSLESAGGGGDFVPGSETDTGSEVDRGDVVEESIADDEDEEDPEDLELEETAFDLIQEHDEGKGAPWEEILAAMSEEGATEAEVEEALNSLMDKGRIYEPILGRLKPS